MLKFLFRLLFLHKKHPVYPTLNDLNLEPCLSTSAHGSITGTNTISQLSLEFPCARQNISKQRATLIPITLAPSFLIIYVNGPLVDIQRKNSTLEIKHPEGTAYRVLPIQQALVHESSFTGKDL